MSAFGGLLSGFPAVLFIAKRRHVAYDRSHRPEADLGDIYLRYLFTYDFVWFLREDPTLEKWRAISFNICFVDSWKMILLERYRLVF
jgi:hypothetical protein